MTKGYVVRGTWQPKGDGAGEPFTVYAYWWAPIQCVTWCSGPDAMPPDGRLLFPTIGEADAALRKSSHLSDVVIFGVAEDGTEERLPSYEKALGELVRLREVLGCKAEEETHVVAERLLTEIERCVDALKGAIGPTPADPLAALEAAERRLLEAGGWTLAEPDVYGNERWSHPTWQGGRRSEGRQMALTIERRRLATKGGA